MRRYRELDEPNDAALAIVNFGMILSRLPQLSLQERLVSVVAGRHNTRPLREECGHEGDGIGVAEACNTRLSIGAHPYQQTY
jgi:hypothetical protein